MHLHPYSCCRTLLPTPIPPAAVEVQGAVHCILCHHQVFVVAAVAAAGAKKERQHARACKGEENGRACMMQAGLGGVTPGL